ncbi:MAG: hypothetical protein RLZ95_1414 [Bacteroidota bacterium]|jgi:hypothetical protein
MFTLTEIVKDGILEVRFSLEHCDTKIYTITNAQGVDILQGKITGNTQRTCLYVGDCKKGKYTFSLGDSEVQEFTIQ